METYEDTLEALNRNLPLRDKLIQTHRVVHDEAFATLQRLAGEQLDAECVEALMRGREEIERIQEQFSEDRIG